MLKNCVATGLISVGLISVLGVATVAAAQGGVAPAGGQSAPPIVAVDVSRLGPQVGEVVPPFAMPDHAGVTRTLKDLLGPKGALLVFSRSADW